MMMMMMMMTKEGRDLFEIVVGWGQWEILHVLFCTINQNYRIFARREGCTGLYEKFGATF